MKLTPQLLSIPPYISTAWKNVAALHTEIEGDELILVVTLSNGIQIQIPELDQSSLEAIFTTHARYIEALRAPMNSFKTPLKHIIPSEELPSLFPFPDSMSFGGPGAALQHDATQSDAPDLPKELLRQVSLFSKTLGIQDPAIAPQPEPHCNCLHCQIARALQTGVVAAQEESLETEEELVSEEDLKFKEWLISDKGNHLFLVENPLDPQESYTVYLKEPLGCTCGKTGCEHIRAVLND